MASEWREVTVRTLVVRTRVRTLGVNVTELPGPLFLVAAVEVPTDPAMMRHGARDLEGLYDDHGHKVVAEHPTLEGARVAAEAYAEMWEAQRERIDACACEVLS